MKAYVYNAYGPPSVVHAAERPTPTPGPGEVLIQIVTTTVSAADWRLRSMDLPKGMGLIGRLAFGLRQPRKEILGTELAGIIAATGPGVTKWQVGDAVIGFPGGDLGAHAEFIAMPETGKLVRKPDTVSFEEAAAMPFGFVTAYDYLVNKAAIQPKETVLINGASGATGSAAVQIAAHIGADVTAVTSGPNAALVKSLGATHVIDYRATDFTQGSARYDVIVDTAATAPWSKAQKALTPGGRLAVISGSFLDLVFAPLRAKLAGKRAITGVSSEAVEILQTGADWMEAGHIRPVIDRIYNAEDIVAAHALVDSKRKKGAVVLRMTDPDRRPA